VLIGSYYEVEVTVNWEPRKQGYIVYDIMVKYISTGDADYYSVPNIISRNS
jgi:hypothetical protein